VHCATVKGKGFAPAEEGGLEGMEKWHAAKPNSIFGGVPAQGAPKPVGVKPAPLQYTQVFGAALVAEARRDDRVLGITAAMSSGTGLNILQRELPDRYFDVGIAEQQAVLLAAGLALQGAKPVVAIYSTFLQRAYDQIVHDVCLQKLNVVFAMDRAGLVGDDGPTHHGAFDIGTGEILRERDRVALLGYGSGVAKALAVAGLLADHGITVTVADARFAKPIDIGLAVQLAAEHNLLVTVEEGVLPGGFGSAVWERLSDAGVAPHVLRVGLPDRFVTHGSPRTLHEEVGFTVERIAARIEAALAEPVGVVR